MEKNETLYIVVPAYNESKNIINFVKDWYPIVEKYNAGGKSRLLIINDGSKDNTYDLLQHLQAEFPYLQPLSKENSGHGPTLIFGYSYALNQGADYIFQTDSDGQTNPQEFENFWKLRKNYDALFGVRTVREDGKFRAFTERVLCILLKCFFSVNIPDSNAPFRLMTASYLKEFLPKLPSDYNLPNVMLTTFGAYYHKKIKFIKITFKNRQEGVNSINIKKIIKIGIKALGDFKRIKTSIKQMEG